MHIGHLGAKLISQILAIVENRIARYFKCHIHIFQTQSCIRIAYEIDKDND